jgi:hypothetical protein
MIFKYCQQYPIICAFVSGQIGDSLPIIASLQLSSLDIVFHYSLLFT